ncbi:GatB/YqeY domain-containing protein [Patescibacteria group bacterium]|nr:GatB/YqeY domain-containing protein [Patescibacteria group bacterium]
MTLAETIREKLKDAMRAKDQIALDTLRSVISGFTSELVAAGKTPQDEVTDDIAMKVITKLVKQRKDSISQFEAGGRADLAVDEKLQLAVLEAYMPEQMSEEKIREIAVAKKADLNLTDKTKSGILTGAVMKEVAGQADGMLVKKVVDSLFD